MCMFTGCNPVDGSSAAQNGLDIDADGEMYTLMSIDTIINGKVRTSAHVHIPTLLEHSDVI